MGTAITPVAPGTTVKILMDEADVSLNPSGPGNVVAMTRRSSQEPISITPNLDGSVTIKTSSPGNIVASGRGSIASSGSIGFVATGRGSIAAANVGNVTIGASGPVVESASANPQPNEDFPYTVYVPRGTTVEFCERRPTTGHAQFLYGDQLRVINTVVA